MDIGLHYNREQLIELVTAKPEDVLRSLLDGQSPSSVMRQGIAQSEFIVGCYEVQCYSAHGFLVVLARRLLKRTSCPNDNFRGADWCGLQVRRV